MNTPNAQTPVEDGDTGMLDDFAAAFDKMHPNIANIVRIHRAITAAVAIALSAIGAAYVVKTIAERPVGSSDTDIVYKVLNGISPIGPQLTPLEDIDAVVEGE